METTATATSFNDVDASISFTSVMRNAGIDAYSYLVEDWACQLSNRPGGEKGDENAKWVQDMMKWYKPRNIQKDSMIFSKGIYPILGYVIKLIVPDPPLKIRHKYGTASRKKQTGGSFFI